MEVTNPPRRVVFRYHVRYQREEQTIISRYLALHQSGEISYWIHTVAPAAGLSRRAHTVLDLHYIENPTPNIYEMPYEVFFVRKQTDFVFRKLDDRASKKASAS
ncbi:hypothetical protein GMOD_00008672 [Pyrenophora seminiperda CCB06]|uniref:Uncharacterized protein n=1 Tax=Pyrenophora seminiperda CCB06 TaxID=1302712 RepID=A0A3M7M920_9PLEO|nr:hypothetical protein GMOD_00008672 [Pyrenophora seminiperda CCB06]